MAVANRNSSTDQDLASPGTLSSSPLESTTGAGSDGHDLAGSALAKNHLTEMTKALQHLFTATAVRNEAAKTLRGGIKKLRKAHKNLSGLMAKAAAPSGDKQEALALMMSTASKVASLSKAYKAACKLHKASTDATQAKVTESILGLQKLTGGGSHEDDAPGTLKPSAGSDREKGSQAFSEVELSSRKAQALKELTKIAETVLENHFEKTTKVAPSISPAPQPGVGDRRQARPFAKSEDNGTSTTAANDSLTMTVDDWKAYQQGDPKAIRKAQAATSLKWMPVPQRILERQGR